MTPKQAAVLAIAASVGMLIGVLALAHVFGTDYLVLLFPWQASVVVAAYATAQCREAGG